MFWVYENISKEERRGKEEENGGRRIKKKSMGECRRDALICLLVLDNVDARL